MVGYCYLYKKDRRHKSSELNASTVECQSKKNVNVICLPREHQGVHKNSFRNVCAFQIELEFGNVGFWGEGKTGVPGEKPLGAE